MAFGVVGQLIVRHGGWLIWCCFQLDGFAHGIDVFFDAAHVVLNGWKGFGDHFSVGFRMRQQAAGEGGFAADDGQRRFQIVGKSRQHLFLHVSFLLLVGHEGFGVFAQVFKGLCNLAKFIGGKTAHFKIEVVIHDALGPMEQLVDGCLPCSAIVPGQEEIVAG